MPRCRPDPVGKRRNPRINPGIARLGAAGTPADHADLHPLALVVGHHQRATAVALAGILAALVKASANGARIDDIAGALVGLLAFGQVHHGQLNPAQAGLPVVRRGHFLFVLGIDEFDDAAAGVAHRFDRPGVAPARHSRQLRAAFHRRVGCQQQWNRCRGRGCFEFDQRDVVFRLFRIVFLVHENLAHLQDMVAGRVDVAEQQRDIVTAFDNLHRCWRMVAGEAMRRRQHPARIDHRTAAGKAVSLVRPELEQGDLPGKVADRRFLAIDDAVQVFQLARRQAAHLDGQLGFVGLRPGDHGNNRRQRGKE